MPDGTAISASRGGVNVWLELPSLWSSLDLFGHAAREGVLFLPGAPFYPAMPAHNTLRLSFGTLPEELAGDAMARFGRALRSYAAACKAGGRLETDDGTRGVVAAV